MIDEERIEYDRFGPWVDHVRTPSDVPRLFRDHPLDLDSARTALKVPRDIARRDATPGMDLYDHLLVLGADDLTVLTRRGITPSLDPHAPEPTGYDVTTVPVDRVAAVHTAVALLNGRLTVHPVDGDPVTVRYNGSARTEIQGLVDALRTAAATAPPGRLGRALGSAARDHADTTHLDAGQDDVALVNHFLELAEHNPGLEPWTCHGRTPLTPRGTGPTGAAARLWHTISPATLQGAVLASDGRALEVLGRREWVVRGRGPVYSSSRLVVPLAAPERLTLAPHRRYDGVVVATLTAGRASLDVLVPEGSAAHALLRTAAHWA